MGIFFCTLYFLLLFHSFFTHTQNSFSLIFHQFPFEIREFWWIFKRLFSALKCFFQEKIQTGVWAPFDFFSSLFSASVSGLVSVCSVMGFLSGVFVAFSVSPANFPFSASSNASFSSSNGSDLSEIFKRKKIVTLINHRG